MQYAGLVVWVALIVGSWGVSGYEEAGEMTDHQGFVTLAKSVRQTRLNPLDASLDREFPDLIGGRGY